MGANLKCIWPQETWFKDLTLMFVTMNTLCYDNYKFKFWILEIRPTYKEPPAAGPIALKRDIADIEIPLAAPLCSWDWELKYSTYEIGLK